MKFWATWHKGQVDRLARPRRPREPARCPSASLTARRRPSGRGGRPAAGGGWALDPLGRTWETCGALTQAAPGRRTRDRYLTVLWVVATAAAIIYAVVGIYVGLAQQGNAADPAAVSCEYRIDLVRDRLVAYFDQKPQRWAEQDAKAAAVSLPGPSGPEPSPGPFGPDRSLGPSGPDLSNLLRETQALCASSNTELARRIDRLLAIYQDFVDRGRRHADARQELLAL